MSNYKFEIGDKVVIRGYAEINEANLLVGISSPGINGLMSELCGKKCTIDGFGREYNNIQSYILSISTIYMWREDWLDFVEEPFELGKVENWKFQIGDKVIVSKINIRNSLRGYGDKKLTIVDRKKSNSSGRVRELYKIEGGRYSWFYGKRFDLYEKIFELEWGLFEV